MTKATLSRSIGALVLLGSVSLVGCAGTGISAAVYVPTAPPRPLREAIVVSPGPGYVWISGYHQYIRGGYVWVPGHWEPTPRPRARWERGRWRHGRQGWYWVEGRWR